MPHFIRAQVVVPMTSGIAADASTNTFVFDTDTDTFGQPSRQTAAEDAHTRLTAFYQAIDGVLFPNTVGPTATVRYYDLAEPEPRIPFHEADITVTNSGQAALPSEVAICLSIEASRGSGLNMRRRRGRLFIGPLGTSATTGLGGTARPSSTAISTLVAAADALMLTVAADDPKWAIFSPTTLASGASLADSIHDVVRGWVDNAFDVIRSRGVAPTARTEFS